jgi:hypothetical protein
MGTLPAHFALPFILCSIRYARVIPNWCIRHKVTHIKELGIRNVSCAVTTEREQSAHDVAGNTIVDAKIIVVSRSVMNVRRAKKAICAA